MLEIPPNPTNPSDSDLLTAKTAPPEHTPVPLQKKKKGKSIVSP